MRKIIRSGSVRESVWFLTPVAEPRSKRDALGHTRIWITCRFEVNFIFIRSDLTLPPDS